VIHINRELKVWLYRKMAEIRAFEEASLPHFQRPGRGSHHPCIGHEAIEAAIGAVLREDDYLFSTHRSHGHLLAKGLEPRLIMAELWGKTTGYCKGRGGSMHVTDWRKRVMPSGIVGTNITLAVGAALATSLRGGDEVAVAAFGDGATNTGAFHEGINMAASWHLPVVLICENNGLAVTTHTKEVTAVAHIADRATAYGIPGWTIDGTDPLASYEAVSKGVERARGGHGPCLIEALVVRWRGHAAWDRGSYLTEAELREIEARDPQRRYRTQLAQEGVLTAEEIEAIDADMKDRMQEALRFAEQSPSPPLTKEEALKYVYCDPIGARV
jgi:TPP-dependent pyruvate/acetoin dehydrogenase alpha subunit